MNLLSFFVTYVGSALEIPVVRLEALRNQEFCAINKNQDKRRTHLLFFKLVNRFFWAAVKKAI